jgi:uncharacterized damage-inducible protein DinB
MTMTEWFTAQLEAEAALSRRALERVPDHRTDWKPHEKSMPMGYLAALVASLPMWVAMTIEHDTFDLSGPEAAPYRAQVVPTRSALVEAHEANVAKARAALAQTTDAHLMKPWTFMVDGQVVLEQPRHVMIRDNCFSHLAHHRGQLTVYLRLNDAAVPALYGPSADER